MSALTADNGIVNVPTQRTVEQGADAFASLIEAKHIILFARIDFAADAQRGGETPKGFRVAIRQRPTA
jgi:hypothetical protein